MESILIRTLSGLLNQLTISFKGKMAVLGGIDLDYVIRSTPEEIYQRSARMLDHASAGYALGTGNSVPDYVPPENYFAMIAAALVN